MKLKGFNSIPLHNIQFKIGDIVLSSDYKWDRSVITKLFTGSPWTHMSIVCDIENNNPMVCEYLIDGIDYVGNKENLIRKIERKCHDHEFLYIPINFPIDRELLKSSIKSCHKEVTYIENLPGYLSWVTNRRNEYAPFQCANSLLCALRNAKVIMNVNRMINVTPGDFINLSKYNYPDNSIRRYDEPKMITVKPQCM